MIPTFFYILFLGGAVAVLILFLTWIAARFTRSQDEANPPPRVETDRPQRPAVSPLRAAGEAAGRAGDTTAACPECGAALAADSPHGLCAPCLLQRAMLSPDPAPSVSPVADAPGSPGTAFVAPDPAELAPHFPQLEILDLLGQGGMGAVYKARQLKLDRFVALKVLPIEWGRDPAFAERFQREARALAKLNHPHIVGVHDFGEAGGHFYLLMEYVDGANLRRVLQGGPLDARLALRIIPQICDALQYAHEEGVVHRDIKPENILLDARGRVKIADFGLAKLVGSSRASFTLTGTHQVMGTLDYMAPEQRSRPQEVDHRADIYSLGVVFYEMLTGELPLGRFAPPSQTSGVDDRIDAVVFRALEREPDKRYQHVSEVRIEVESISGGATPAVAPAAGGGAPGAPVSEDIQLRVQGLAAALLISAAGAVIQWIVLLLTTYSSHPGGWWSVPDSVTVQYGFVLAVVLVVALLIVIGAAKLRRFDGYGFVVAAIILAMLPWSMGFLIGLPAAIWTFRTLLRPEVRAAFAANLRSGAKKSGPKLLPRPQPTGPVRRQARSFWRCLPFDVRQQPPP